MDDEDDDNMYQRMKSTVVRYKGVLSYNFFRSMTVVVCHNNNKLQFAPT